MKTIVIPERFVDLCCDWHGGTDCMLYAVASTGTLIIGSIRPKPIFCNCLVYISHNSFSSDNFLKTSYL